MRNLLFAIGLFLAPSSQLFAASVANMVLMPTDQNVNLLNFGTVSGTAQLGLFDDDIIAGGTAVFSGATFLPLDLAGDIAAFSPTIGQTTNYAVSNNNNDTFTLSGNDNFLLALNTGSGFSLPDSISCSSATGSCMLGWTSGTVLYAVDTALAPVPLPAALPLLLTGLFGIGMFYRRRAA